MFHLTSGNPPDVFRWLIECRAVGVAVRGDTSSRVRFDEDALGYYGVCEGYAANFCDVRPREEAVKRTFKTILTIG